MNLDDDDEVGFYPLNRVERDEEKNPDFRNRGVVVEEDFRRVNPNVDVEADYRRLNPDVVFAVGSRPLMVGECDGECLDRLNRDVDGEAGLHHPNRVFDDAVDFHRPNRADDEQVLRQNHAAAGSYWISSLHHFLNNKILIKNKIKNIRSLLSS